MTRFALYTLATTLLIGAGAAQAQNAVVTGAPAEHRALIAALQACDQQLVEQSRREKCEMQARKTDGAEVKLSRRDSDSVYSFQGYP